MSDVSDFDRQLTQLISNAEQDLAAMDRAKNNLIEVHQQMNTLRGLYDLVERDKQNFVRDFQAKIEALRHESHNGQYNLDDSDPMPRIMQHAQQYRQELHDQGVYQQHPYGYEAAE